MLPQGGQCLRWWEVTDDLVKPSPEEEWGCNSDVCWLSTEGAAWEREAVKVGWSVQKCGHLCSMGTASSSSPGSFPALCSDNLDKLTHGLTSPIFSSFNTQHRTHLTLDEWMEWVLLDYVKERCTKRKKIDFYKEPGSEHEKKVMFLFWRSAWRWHQESIQFRELGNRKETQWW